MARYVDPVYTRARQTYFARTWLSMRDQMKGVAGAYYVAPAVDAGLQSIERGHLIDEPTMKDGKIDEDITHAIGAKREAL